MGQKIRPTGFRTGIMVGWASQWYANKRDFSDLLVEDVKIRAFVEKFLTRRGGGNRDQRPGISKIRIDRTREKVVVTHPLGQAGRDHRQEGREHRQADEGARGPHPSPHRSEDDRSEPPGNRRPIGRRGNRRATGETGEFSPHDEAGDAKVDGSGARGIKLQLSGRLGGAEMARCEKAMDGSIPLSTLRTRVEYGFAEASTPQGNIGIKCWVNNGDYLTEETTDAANAQTRQVSQKPARTRKR